MIAWYWVLICSLLGLSGGLLIRVFRINRLLSSLSEVGEASVSPAELKERIEEEFRDDNRREEIIERLKKILEESKK